mmetsp:Transcript_22792/g.31277  ORF Transcript_22792/g.31277 Transcript_22792/m.31277 type:complete len:272 (+) Transcript_22792:3935-4750(+)
MLMVYFHRLNLASSRPIRRAALFLSDGLLTRGFNVLDGSNSGNFSVVSTCLSFILSEVSFKLVAVFSVVVLVADSFVASFCCDTGIGCTTLTGAGVTCLDEGVLSTAFDDLTALETVTAGVGISILEFGTGISVFLIAVSTAAFTTGISNNGVLGTVAEDIDCFGDATGGTDAAADLIGETGLLALIGTASDEVFWGAGREFFESNLLVSIDEEILTMSIDRLGATVDGVDKSVGDLTSVETTFGTCETAAGILSSAIGIEATCGTFAGDV